MLREVTRLDLRLRRRLLLGTAFGSAAYLFVVVAVYPSFRHDTAFDEVIAANPAAAAAFGISGSITSPAGWLSANLYANVGPLLALLLTIGYGASAIAGQNAEGLLGLVATRALSRSRIVTAKLAALVVVASVVPVVAYGVCLAGPRFQLTPDWSHLSGVTLALTLLAFDLGAVALLVGALTASRGAALGVAAGVAAVAYLVTSLSAVSSAVHSVRWLSPFTWAVGADQLSAGVTVGQLAGLGLLGLALAAGSLLAVRRLDIG